MTANIVRESLFNCIVCVPKEWTDDEAYTWVNTHHVCGTERGWIMCKQGDKMLHGTDERVQCTKYPENVHIMFAA